MIGPASTTGAPGGRVLAMDGIDNFRDYGDYPAADGSRVRPRHLWRSGQHADASPADLERVAALGLATVFDLRGDSEREAHPCLRPDGFGAEIVFSPGDTSGLRAAAVHEEAAARISTVAEARAAMLRSYASMPWRPVLVASLMLFLESLARREGPSLLHCLAGKDRTGLAAALLHHLLGVHPDDAMADYLLTNTATDIGRRVDHAVRRIRSLAGERDVAVVRVLMSVEPEYLETARAAMRERHGSIDAYLVDVLQVTPASRQTLRERLLV